MDDLRTPETWSPEDDAFLRGALLSLRADVDAEPLPEPAFVRARGDATRRRRMVAITAGVAAAAVIVGALGFRGLADDRAGPPPLPTEPTPSLTTSAPTTTTSPTPTATPTSSATSSPSATAATGTSSPTATSAPSTSPSSVIAPTSTPTGSSCPVPRLTADTRGVPAAAAETARTLMAGAVACDEDALVARFTADGTQMSFGVGAVADHMRLPDNIDRYSNLAALLTLQPSSVGAEGYLQWPKEPETDAEWKAIIDSGLHTDEEVAQMKAFGGYTGWRVVMAAATGQVTAYLAGD